MRMSLFKISISAGIALSLLIGSSLPAAALTFKGEGFYARFGPSMATDVRGLVVGDRIGGDSPRLNVGLVGLLPHVEFSIVGRSIGCGGTPRPGNRVFKVNAMANGHGDWFRTGILAEWGRPDIESIWINWGDGSTCQLSLNFEKYKTELAATDNGDGGLALTKEGTGTLILLLEKRPNQRARLSIVVGGLDGNDEIRVRLVNRQCGQTPTKTLVAYRETDFNFSSFVTKTVPLTQNQLDSIRSMRVTNVSDDNKWNCGPVSILIGLLLP